MRGEHQGATPGVLATVYQAGEPEGGFLRCLIYSVFSEEFVPRAKRSKKRADPD